MNGEPEGRDGFREALSNDHVTVVDVDAANRVFRFRLGQLNTVVMVRVSKRRVASVAGRPYQYTASHALHTPKLAAPYRSSHPYGDTPEATLAKAVEDLVWFYGPAVRDGHEPSETWLAPNPRFVGPGGG